MPELQINDLLPITPLSHSQIRSSTSLIWLACFFYYLVRVSCCIR